MSATKNCVVSEQTARPEGEAVEISAAVQVEDDGLQAGGPRPVLIVEPESADVERILERLEKGGFAVDPVVVTDFEEFVRAISEREFAAVISAYRLRNRTGLEAMQHLQRLGKDTPFILVTGAIGEDAAVECVKQGVSDYVLKDHLSRLPVALERALGKKSLRDAHVQVMAALAASEERNRALVEESVYGIFRFQRDGGFTGANPALLQMLACSSVEEVRNLSLASDVFRYPEHYVRLVAICREEGLVQSAETEWRRKDGGLISVRLHLRYLSLPGPSEAFEGIAEDITEVRALEHQLEQAQKFESIGQLAGGIAHDFNNVVGAILGWAELGYEQSRAYPAIAERFSRIRTQAERAAALTRELLAFARRQPMQKQPVDLNALVSNFGNFLDKVIGKDIEIRQTLGATKRVYGDATQIEQVLMNLCLNSRDAMPEGGRLTIETEQAVLEESYCRVHAGVSAGQYTVLSVSDTGIGMDPETRERVFEPFFTTKERGKGSGMGLATVYGIVKQHNGSIEVYSEAGQGSLFRVYLPASGADVTDKESSRETPIHEHDLRGTEVILFAEDDDSIREMVRQALISFGYRVLAATDGHQALSLCDHEAPELAVLDVVMPQLSGAATAVKLRERFPEMPILFTSGYSERSGITKSPLLSPHYLQKPYSPTSLCRMIRKILPKRKVA